MKFANFPLEIEPNLSNWLTNFAGVSVKANNALSFGKPYKTAFLKFDKNDFVSFKSAVESTNETLFSAKIFKLKGAWFQNFISLKLTCCAKYGSVTS